MGVDSGLAVVDMQVAVGQGSEVMEDVDGEPCLPVGGISRSKMAATYSGFHISKQTQKHQTRNPQADLLEDRRHRSAVAVAAKDCEVEEDNGRAAECSGLGRQSGESTFDLWPDFGEP